MKIYGAGIAGMLAGCVFQHAHIFEAGPENQANHKAVLRFRSSAVGDAVGIEFRKVRVHKGLALDGMFVEPTIQLANWYSRKVIGRLADRSVWHLEPVDRFIAPEDFIGQLADRCAGRIHWGHAISADELRTEREQAISTLPMSVMAKMIGAEGAPTFQYAPIVVRRWRVRASDVFQTIYFPAPDLSLYRASITGDLLIAEYCGAGEPAAADAQMFEVFGLEPGDCTPLEEARQRFGKIAPIDEAWRKSFIFNLTHKHNVFSLGRFGTWRNLLLDDVIKDLSVLKRLVNASHYDRARANA